MQVGARVKVRLAILRESPQDSFGTLRALSEKRLAFSCPSLLRGSPASETPASFMSPELAVRADPDADEDLADIDEGPPPPPPADVLAADTLLMEEAGDEDIL